MAEKIIVTRTIKFDITDLLTQQQYWDISNTLDLFPEMYKETLRIALKEKTVSAVKLNKLTYTLMKEKYPIMPTAYIQIIRNQVIGSIKSYNTQNPKRKWLMPVTYIHKLSLNLNKLTLSQRGDLITISTVGKRTRFLLKTPKWVNEKYPIRSLQAGTIHKRKDKIVLHLIYNITLEVEENKKREDENVVGIDRGLYNVISTSKGLLVSSKKIRNVQRKYLYTRKTLQQKGTKSAKKKLRKIAGKEKRFMRDVNHCITKKLANDNSVSTYVLEDLKGIRKGRKGKKMNKWLSSWSFYQLEEFLKYKCEAKRIQVVKVDPKYTSQTCSCCGIVDKTSRKKNWYICNSCKFKIHADLNAALNIKHKYLLTQSKLGRLLVNQPNVSNQ